MREIACTSVCKQRGCNTYVISMWGKSLLKLIVIRQRPLWNTQSTLLAILATFTTHFHTDVSLLFRWQHCMTLLLLLLLLFSHNHHPPSVHPPPHGTTFPSSALISSLRLLLLLLLFLLSLEKHFCSQRQSIVTNSPPHTPALSLLLLPPHS